MNEIPILEIECDECHGDGNEHWHNGSLAYCQKCKGAGYIPTDSGRLILALVSHNIRIDTADVSFFNRGGPRSSHQQT
jgi:hypothetical protein